MLVVSLTLLQYARPCPDCSDERRLGLALMLALAHLGTVIFLVSALLRDAWEPPAIPAASPTTRTEP
jgi:hypothetical protein